MTQEQARKFHLDLDLDKMELLCWRVAALMAAWAMSSTTFCSPTNYSSGDQRISPQGAGLRPGPPFEDLPPPDLIENPNKHYDPRPHDLNATVLRAKLGRNFDPTFMSVNKPRHHNHRTNQTDTIEFPFRRNKKGRLVPVGEMPRSLRKMNFKYIRLPDGTRLRTRMSAKLKRKLQQFLWAYTACPVVYRWKDLGVRFWPRYLKEGYCPPGKSSCSIPPGMKCRPAAKVHKTILRWHCHSTHRNLLYSSVATAVAVSTSGDVTISSAPKQCQWIKVEYPLVTQCSCSCPSNGSYS
uniref:Noggin n=2 Tax=Timema TaxID=61471 RepID=A0A7R8VTR3_TIMDO|nr:unnamed protein product [Timema douglasi]